MVIDADGDGKAEMAVKTAPGTKDATGATSRSGPAASATHTMIYRNSDGYILSGPEYLTVFNGQTGAEMATVDFPVQRGTVSSWGDSYGNRVDRFLATAAYVDTTGPAQLHHGARLLHADDAVRDELARRAADEAVGVRQQHDAARTRPGTPTAARARTA